MILIFPCDRNIVSKILNIKAKYTNLRDERRVIFMRVTKLVIGILMIVYSENSDGLGGDIAGFAMMIVARILGFFGGTYAGLIWTGILALIIGIGFFVWHLKTR